GQAGARRGAGVRRDPSGAPGHPRAGGRRAGPRCRRAGNRPPQAAARRPLFRQSGQRGRHPAGQRPVPAALGDGIVRARRTRSDGVRRPRARERGGWSARGGRGRRDGLSHAAPGRRRDDRPRRARIAGWGAPRPAPGRGEPAGGRLTRGTADLCVVAGAVAGLAAAALVNGSAVLAGAAALVVMIAYSPVLKRRGLPGNLAVALVAGLPLLYGAIAVDRPAAGLVP